MKKYEKILTSLFCGVLLIGGVATMSCSIKTIGKATLESLKTGWNSGSNIESSLAEGFFGKEKIIDLYGLVERVLGRTYIRDVNPSNVVLKDNHDQLQFISFKTDNTKSIEHITSLNEVLKEKGIPLLYVQTPLKIIEDFTELPESVLDYSKENTDTFLEELDKANVDYLDLRENMIEDNLDLETLFYKTDHHWTTQTAFWAVDQVVDELAERYGMVLDVGNVYTNLDNYNLTTYPDFFLGSQGRRVGRLYAGVDDYTLITPKFDTNYEVTINKSDSSRTSEGSFEEAILKQDLLDETKSVYTNRYASYFGADYPEVIVKNKNQEGHKVLIIKDSFALPFSAFLSTMCEETRMLDLRYYDVENLEAYIEDYNPDLVLFVYKSIKTE